MHERFRNSRGAYTPPLLVARHSPADGSATFAMYKRTRSRSGRRKPTVRLADALPRTLRQLLGRLPPACWRTPLQWRSCNSRGAYAPRSCSRAVRPPAELRLFRCTNAHPQERRPGAHRGAGSALAKTIPHTFADDRRAQARSGGCQPAVFVGNARARMTRPGFTQRRRARIRSGGCQPAVCRADALAKALLHLLGRLPTGVLAHSVAVAFP